jgi:asparagine synthase (glutamine-hydrolysing)
LEGLLSEEFKAEIRECNPYRISEMYSLNVEGREYLSPFMYYDTKVYLPDDILVKVDRMSMAHSLETRVPFLDHRLVEFVATIPDNLKLRKSIRGKIGKYILKRAFNTLLPEVIQKRQKHGFTLPVDLWFRDELREMALDVLSESQVKRIGILNPRAVSQMLHEHLQGKASHTETLWSCFVFVLWYQNWIEMKQVDESNRFSSVGLGRLFRK